MSSKRKDSMRGSKKRLRLDSGEEVAWGEAGSAEEEESRRFLYSTITPTETVPNKRKTIQLLCGQEWLCRSILKEVLESAVEMVGVMGG